MNKAEIVSCLNRSSLFSSFSREAVELAAERFHEKIFRKDEIVFYEGDKGGAFYIVAAGEFSIFKETGRGIRELKRIGPGEVFGEMAMITQERRSATVRAIKNSLCLMMDEADFSDWMKKDEPFSRNIFKILSHRLNDSNDRYTKEIFDAHQAIIFSLASLAESRDPTTGSHLYRVREHCALLARLLCGQPNYLNVTPVFVESIYIVSPLHDIGKVAIPDGILLKTGGLSPSEFEIMKSHTTAGAKSMMMVLEYCDNETFRIAHNIVHYHHERYNGAGYPCGLRGEEIPIEARIIALADVYDALRSKRPYKPSLSHREAAEEINNMAGTFFDPAITEIMLAHIEGFEEIDKKYRSNDE